MYAWLLTGRWVLKKIENIVREEMNNAGAVEVSMPVVLARRAVAESGRWDDYGPRAVPPDRPSQPPLRAGSDPRRGDHRPGRYEVNSYWQLPLNLYQIQTKFRDEVRPVSA